MKRKKWYLSIFGAKARVIAALIVLIVFSTVISLVAIRQILWLSLKFEIEQSLNQEVQEFRRLRGGRNPLTGEPFGDDIATIFDVFYCSCDRVLDILQQIPEVRDLPGAISAPDLRGLVEFEQVSFAYELGQPDVLKNINFKVDPGQHVALIGASGGGKSTLASLILRLYDPVQGAVLIDGRDIRQYTLESLRSQISVVMQDSILFAASVRDNISHSMPLATQAEIRAAAQLANAHEFIEALPQGYDTVLGERGVSLSGGQRQRIAIARAALRHSPILILDEPTTGLDEQNEREVIKALERLAQNRTSFIITHDLHLAAHADLILYFQNGQIVERGTHQELMDINGSYADLYKMQFAKHSQSTNQGESDVLIP